MKKFSWHTTKKSKNGMYYGIGLYNLDEGLFVKYKPNMKGGHRHNHIYNVCNRILFRSKNARQIDPTQKQEWRKTFEIQVFGELKRIAQINFLDILKKGKYARITKKRRSNG